MNRNEAKKIAETVSNKDLNEMFKNAQSSITDWKQVSRVNIGLSKGIAFNILSNGFGKEFDESKAIHILAKINMIREFGEFLPNYSKPIRKERTENSTSHQEPNFLNF